MTLDGAAELLPLMQVAFMPPYPNPVPPDAVGELAFIDLSDLYIDPRYQRPIGFRGEKNIRQVIENFSWSLFSPIVVGRREGGRFAIIDGQHRAIAALTHGGIQKVPALIINGDEHDEAKAFAVINGAVTAILPTQIWHARVVAGDYDALLLQRCFDANGITVLRSPKPEAKMGVGETVAVDAFEKCFKKFGRPVFELALQTVVKTGGGNPGYLRSPLLQATCGVLHANPKWANNPEGVLRAIKTVGIKYLWEITNQRRADSKMTVVAQYSHELTTLLKKELP